MNEVVIAEKIKSLTAAFLEKGFSFSYFYQKGGDSSCVYVCRYQKGKDFFDWREVSGANEIHFVVYVNGEYRFPSLQLLYKKEYRMFSVKHFFKKATMDEWREFTAKLLNTALASNPHNFFGIPLS